MIEKWFAGEIIMGTISAFATCISAGVAAFLFSERRKAHNATLFELRYSNYAKIRQILSAAPLKVEMKVVNGSFEDLTVYPLAQAVSEFESELEKSRFLFDEDIYSLLVEGVSPKIEEIKTITNFMILGKEAAEDTLKINMISKKLLSIDSEFSKVTLPFLTVE